MKEKLIRSDSGSAVVEVAMVLPVFLLLLIGAWDLGQMFTAAIQVQSAAHAGALYGVQSPADVSGMITAATSSSGLSGIKSTASYGCECPDGSVTVPSCSAVPMCSESAVDYVEVTTTKAYAPLFVYPGIPSPITFQSVSRMRTAH